ncbi:hypothetical protein [uncultured Microbulbifer sp.]|uniref:hypothetical protein n=1 Tax=uncultured Microbulbifer sp. TaxID=348147 RepID=UPI0025D5B097|nr:hypothetical protein [uncultured Microbulbifer sp.]
MKQRWIFLAGLVSGCGLVTTGCSSTGNVANLDGFWCDLTGTPTTYVQPSLPAYLTPAYPRNCFTGDMEVPDAGSCVAGTNCYQLDAGAWCTVEDAAG